MQTGWLVWATSSVNYPTLYWVEPEDKSMYFKVIEVKYVEL